MFFAAFFSMILDHIGLVLYPDEYIFRILGRLAFPCFVFMIVEGIKRTRDLNKYIYRMALIAVISQVPYMYMIGSFKLNTCFSLLLILLIFKFIRNQDYLPALIYSIMSVFPVFDYGFLGVLFALIYYYIKDFPLQYLLLAVVTIAYSLIYNSEIQVFTIIYFPLVWILATLPDINVYPRLKYSLYPGHLIILAFTLYIHNIVM